MVKNKKAATRATNERIWSAQQGAIFDWFRSGTGNLVVRARAGTGKTTTILEGINHAPEQMILLAAFNKKIAIELTEKLRNENAEAKTLHSVGYGLVMKQWGRVNLDPLRSERLANDVVGFGAPGPAINLVKRLAALGKNMMPFATKDQLMELAELHDVEPTPDLLEHGYDLDRIAFHAVEAMEAAAEKDKERSIDFDDMVYLPVRNKWLRGRFDMVVIDECQDMNATQIALAMGVCARDGRIAVVGDDCQAIYGFRGADSTSLDRLKKELRATELGLTITYRCPKQVVAIAKQLVPDYTAAPTAPEGVVRTIGEETMLMEAQPGDFILSRKNAPLASICIALLKMGKRARMEGKDIGKGIQALVKSLRPKSIPHLLERLKTWREKEVERAKANPKTVEARVTTINDKADLLIVLCEGMTGLQQLDQRITDLFSDFGEVGSDKIVCSSIHRSKGLETDRVYILQNTLALRFPVKNPKEAAARKVEERNIKYVGVTRAKKELVWVNDNSRSGSSYNDEGE